MCCSRDGISQMNEAVETNAKATIRAYIVENLFLGEMSQFDEDSSLLDSGALDSTAAMELVAFLEQTFRIEIKDQEITPDNLETVNRIAAMVARKTMQVAAE